MASIFDANTFLEIQQKPNLDSWQYKNPDIGDYLAQITDKLEIRSGTIGQDKQRAGQPWATLDIQWEIMDDAQKAKLNMDKVFVRQSLMLDLNNNNQLDLSTNKNMRLRRLLDSTGLLSGKGFSLGMLKFATAVVHVEHRPDPNDPEIIYSEVTRVTSPAKAQARAAQ